MPQSEQEPSVRVAQAAACRTVWAQSSDTHVSTIRTSANWTLAMRPNATKRFKAIPELQFVLVVLYLRMFRRDTLAVILASSRLCRQSPQPLVKVDIYTFTSHEHGCLRLYDRGRGVPEVMHCIWRQQPEFRLTFARTSPR